MMRLFSQLASRSWSSCSFKEAFNWFFGKERNLEAEEQPHKEQLERRSEASRRRSEGYEWLFEVEG